LLCQPSEEIFLIQSCMNCQSCLPESGPWRPTASGRSPTFDTGGNEYLSAAVHFEKLRGRP
jgi:hypothetical protein